MKKILIGGGLILVAGILVIAFLPKEKKFIQTATADCPIETISRNIAFPTNWKNWWPGKQLTDSTYQFNQDTFLVKTILLNGFYVVVQNSPLHTSFNVQLVAKDGDRSEINITTQFQFSTNPWTKLLQYISLSSEKAITTQLLRHLESHFSSTEKTYGFKIEKQKVPNSSYISTKKGFNHFPSNEEIYALIKELEIYIAQQNSKIMNAPILNIYTYNNKDYEVMVAIATDRDLASTNQFFLKNMMLGNIMVAEVKGDRKRIDSCIQAMKFYISDYRKSSPAIYFERLITNRLTEKDSTKWVTTINYL
ncbi:MAG: hypothetical protein EAZ12_05610 [Sphingobacteriia bacterium]|nr:MAG: hypothetical protein EAZ12_05610 [Sphingobacteriia bacterium]